MKIIILKRDKLGDLLLTTPALQLLKKIYPKAKLSVVAPESSAWVLKDAPFIDHLYTYPQPNSSTLKSIFNIFLQLYVFLKIRKENYYYNGDTKKITTFNEKNVFQNIFSFTKNKLSNLSNDQYIVTKNYLNNLNRIKKKLNYSSD